MQTLRAVVLLVLALASRSLGQVGTEGFRPMIADAVAKMHMAMNVPFSGDADHDFARMMIPHHQGAIDIALVELRFGKDEHLRRLAQEIIAKNRPISNPHVRR
jgi:uncharacterized protein (DUF305 family)